ncbi:endonuclease domain-containing protein [Bradyrhizobium sp.]|uniref:endonuclease domain-containing protein n=1 Tax=Bradyrhizobium sp. TaxID=376 RepID=UPI0040378223
MDYLDQIVADDLAATDFKPFASCLALAVDYAAKARALGPGCDSPIEVELGVRVERALRVIGDPTLSLKPRYFLSSYIYDLAIFREGRPYPIIIVECDGKDFHSTPEQLQNDARKNKLARSKGIALLRFTGSEIHRTPDDCVAKILQMMRFMRPSQLTQGQCDLLDAAGIQRHPPLPTYNRD